MQHDALDSPETPQFCWRGGVCDERYEDSAEARAKQDVEAQDLNPRRAKSEKDIVAALQDWKNHEIWLIKADYTHKYELLKQHDGKTAITILIKMMLTDGRYPLQKYLQDYLSKNNFLRCFGGEAFCRATL